MSFGAKKFLANLKEKNVKVVVFDMDNTAIRMHSSGALRVSKFKDYCQKVSPDFLEIVPFLIILNIRVAIATFSDEGMEKGATEHYREPCYAGNKLVNKMLTTVFPDRSIASQVYAVGYYPKYHRGGKLWKLHHLDKISEHFNVSLKDCVLFDDTRDNVDNHGEFTAYAVDGSVGFRFSDYTE